jgi:hypothetical protein
MDSLDAAWNGSVQHGVAGMVGMAGLAGYRYSIVSVEAMDYCPHAQLEYAEQRVV